MDADHSIARWLSVQCGHVPRRGMFKSEGLEFILPNPTWANLFPLWTSFLVSVTWELKCLLYKIIVSIKWDVGKALR